MESVVATVSGYHGTERFNLIKFISLAGANYVGNLSRSITHLVCWRFEGSKYEIAKRLKIKIVNHRWVEDCIKKGKRLPEDPYMLQSGEEMGPLLLKITDVDKGDALTKKTKVFSDKTNVDYGGSGFSGWSRSTLLDEQGKSSSSASKLPTRNKRKISKNKRPNTHCSAQLPREERGILNGSRSASLATSSQKKRGRLVKNVNREIIVSSDSDQECYPPLNIHKPHVEVTNPFDHSPDRTVNLCETGEPSNRDFCKHKRLRRVDEEIEEVEGINLRNNQPPSNGLTSPRKDAQPVTERASPDGCADAERENQDVASRSSTSMNISCVICHTEFSPTRGVLLCGHRFCYSCIQKWADNMIASRKKPLCPLCKANFTSITKVEDAAISDQKVFSQTIPCAISTLDVPIFSDQERTGFGAQTLKGAVVVDEMRRGKMQVHGIVFACSERIHWMFAAASVCIVCCSREPEDLLISCHLCQIRNIHVYCLDPPLSPWICIHCKDLARLNPYNIH